MAFFESLGKRLTDAGQNVVQQTKDLAEVTKLNNAISEKERQISRLFAAIGQSYYEAHKDDPTAEEPEKIAEITSLYADIFANREKIKQIKGVTKCENCGADVPLNAVFCNACGAKVIRKEVNKNTTGNERLCPVCHSVVGEGNLFCNHCGAKIDDTNE